MRIITLMGMMLVLNVYGTSYSLIIHADSAINHLDVSELRDLYLYKRSYINDQKIIPVNLLANNTARKDFETGVLKMQRAQLNAYWVKQHFKGISPPVTQASYNAVLRFVTNVQGAIGYVPSSSVNENVKVLYEF